MAFYTETLNSNTSIFARVADVFATAKVSAQNYNTYRKTLNELNAMTHRELDDIGINASMIPSIAHEAAFGK